MLEGISFSNAGTWEWDRTEKSQESFSYRFDNSRKFSLWRAIRSRSRLTARAGLRVPVALCAGAAPVAEGRLLAHLRVRAGRLDLGVAHVPAAHLETQF